jgi:hypothetical protein
MKVNKRFDRSGDIGSKEHNHIRKGDLWMGRAEVLCIIIYLYETFTRQWKPCGNFAFRVKKIDYSIGILPSDRNEKCIEEFFKFLRELKKGQIK